MNATANGMKGISYYILRCYVVQIIILSFSPAFGQSNRVDSATAIASTQYSRPNLLKRILLGSNYRKEWATPATMPVFDLKKTHGGMTIVELGGGEQTKSLLLRDRDGTEWSLRMVDKDVEKAVPTFLQNTAVEKVVQDLISAAYPYGAVTVTLMSEAAGIITPGEELYFVPDNASLGEFREMFGNTVCLLVQREPVYEGSKLFTTGEMEEKLKSGNYRVHEESVLRARLMDMLIADWDRHTGQWRWVVKDSAGIKYFMPVPRDRDQAYFRSDGILVKLVSFLFIPHVKGFNRQSRGIKGLSRKSWDFDTAYLGKLSKEDWERITIEFHRQLDDTLISSAVSRLPKEIFDIGGNDIIQKLKSRRDGLLKHILKYQRFLMKRRIL